MQLKELAAKLVSFNTVSSESPVPMADFICNYLEGCGFVIERYPYLTTIPKIENVAERVVEKVNIIARKGGQESRLVHSGHMDTVPFGSGWDNKVG